MLSSRHCQRQKNQLTGLRGTYRQIEWQTETETDRQRERQTEREADRERGRGIQRSSSVVDLCSILQVGLLPSPFNCSTVIQSFRRPSRGLPLSLPDFRPTNGKILTGERLQFSPLQFMSIIWVQRFGVKLRHSIRPVSGAPLSDRLVDLKRRYRICLNE